MPRIVENLKVAQTDEVEEGIFSFLSTVARKSSYNNKVNAYDTVIGNRLYNRFVGGNWPSTFNVEQAEFEGLELCEPCALFAKRTHREVIKFFLRKCGLRARIIKGGFIRVGEHIEARTKPSHRDARKNGAPFVLCVGRHQG